MMPQTADKEVLSRVRRIETRLTQTMVALGIDTQAQKPVFVERDGEAEIHVPSPHSSIRETMDAVPENYRGSIKVFIGDEHITTLDT